MEKLVVNCYLLNRKIQGKFKLFCFAFIFIFCFDNIKCIAQVDSLVFTPDTFYALCGNHYIIDSLEVLINYNSQEPINVYWKVERGNNFDPKLKTQVTDRNLDYNEEILQSRNNKPNNFPDIFPGPYGISLKIIDEYNYDGCDTIFWEFYSDNEFVNKFKSIVIFMGCCNVNSVVDTYLDFTVFPNPIVTNILNIKTSQIYQRIEIYSLLGQKIIDKQYDQSGSYDIGSLS